MPGLVITSLCLCLLAACQSQQAEQPSAPPSAAAERVKAADQTQQAERRSADSTAAADVVRQYYAAIQARDFGTAYALWADHGNASRQSFEAFQAGFAETRTTSVTIDQPGTIEGAAGSLYISIPVTVHAELNDGESQQFSGNYLLRRVNDVEGSTPEQRSWHLHSASLHIAK